ncbi:MAG: hypothetical protein Fur0046_31560 [Cyanobacteria bacterium J069]|nr:MAG: hypothetical protein D6742_01935 [Cyanobacteria bacterium J069]
MTTNERVDQNIERDTYDRGIVPAETAARKEREGDTYKQKPTAEGDIDTAGGYSVDNEGLVNNFAIEPEMYYEEPGDLREKKEAEAAARAAEMAEINDTNESGKLTEDGDERSKGVGII